jgi:Fic family protein
MRWNWQQPDWPNFRWSKDRLFRAEDRFLHGAGVLIGATKHLDGSDRDRLLVEAMSVEALTTSEIEGEILNRASVQSSIQRQLGLASDRRRIGPTEQGISELMVSLHRSINEPLREPMLFDWHRMVVSGRTDIRDVGRFRTSIKPMLVVSGAMYAPKVHFEAPSASLVPEEMTRFLEWFNATAPGTSGALSALTRAGIAHLYFESVHPFEDGNGRIGRAIAEKALIQGFGQTGFGQTVMVALARSLLAHHREYYQALEKANKRNEITEWLAWFAGVAIEAQHRTLAQVEFLIDKTRLLDSLRGRMNDRQSKVVLRMLQEGPEGFEGGMNAKKYSSVAGSSPATTTRDLAGLVELGAFTRSGELKYTRYALNLPLRPTPKIRIDAHGDVIGTHYGDRSGRN